MEELQDAIEDAQYVTAIAAQEDGPRPVLAWDIPTAEQLALWESKRKTDSTNIDSTLQSPIGLFLFSAYLKNLSSKHASNGDINKAAAAAEGATDSPAVDDDDDYLRINFCEDVARFKTLQGRARLELGRRIVKYYILNNSKSNGNSSNSNSNNNDSSNNNESNSNATDNRLPPRTEIEEYDLYRDPPKGLPMEELKALYSISMDYPNCTDCCVGLKGAVRTEVVEALKELEQTELAKGEDALPSLRLASENPLVEEDSSHSQTNTTTTITATTTSTTTGDSQERPSLDMEAMRSSMRDLTERMRDKHLIGRHMFDRAEALVMENLRRQYWTAFLESPEYVKLKNFLWFQDRPVVPDDFFVMRILGRGGFGLVHACKKCTSGKLYAMKVMNKRRIKMKKSELLALNEQQVLAAVESPFVVNLKYSFHAKDEIYLILDLMTGGDLGFHLHQKGRFPKREVQYYAARIMLGLQALHDKKYVYRDLKPENCLLAEDGRVKITDLGLATKITPTLHGAAGTRGYWAPEMLRRDKNGKRKPYGHTVDWFSFGCCVAEFISGSNPFRSEAALNFGLERGKQTKEKAIDCATSEMDPILKPEKFEPDAADLCRRLLDKNENTRLGTQGCEEIMAHPYFKNVNWESIISDRKRPPFVPAKDVNAASQSEIGNFAEDKAYKETNLADEDEKIYDDWDWTNPHAFAAEVIEFLIYERETGEPLVPMNQHGGCCCTLL